MPVRVLRLGSAILITSILVAMVALSLRPTGAEPGWLAVLGRVVPLTLLAAAVAQWFSGRTLGSVAATLAALSWAGVTWAVASVNRSNALLGLGLLVAPMLVPWIVLQITELPTRWRPGHRKSILAVAFVGIGLSGVLRALIYEPLLDLNCGPFCGHSPVLLMSNIALSAALAALASWTTMLVCAVVGLAILFRLLRPPVAGLRANAPGVLVIGAMVALSTTPVLGISRFDAPSSFDIALVLTIEGGACVAVAVAVLLVTRDRRTVQRNLAEVASLLGAQDDVQSVEGILSHAVGDPDLRVGYWTDERGFVGGDGQPVGETVSGRQRTELISRGRPVAIVIHDGDSVPADLLLEHFGPQARLAIQNESLQLQLRRRVDELRASRRRIAEAGEAERRSLERDLHDGAQQLLLALSFELRRGERVAAGAGDVRSTAMFSAARETATRTLEELRTLAHGIHPDILTGAGLEEALISYGAMVTPSPKFTFDIAGRLPPKTESAVYAIVTALVGSAPGSQVSISRAGDTVRVLADGVREVPEHVLDRLGAAGGSSARGREGLEFVLPCA